MTHRSLVGTILDGRYRIESVLGAGGMGTVYLATQLAIDRPVAVKVIHPTDDPSSRSLERFRLEARAVSRLEHPNVVRLYDFGASDNTPYIVMERLHGETVRQIADQRGPVLDAHS